MVEFQNRGCIDFLCFYFGLDLKENQQIAIN